MFAVTAPEFTAKGTANIFVNKYIPLWGFPRTIRWNTDLQFYSKTSHAVYQLLETRQPSPCSYHPNGNELFEPMNHTMALLLAMDVNENEDGWDLHFPHVEFYPQQFSQCRDSLGPQRGAHG